MPGKRSLFRGSFQRLLDEFRVVFLALFVLDVDLVPLDGKLHGTINDEE